MRTVCPDPVPIARWSPNPPAAASEISESSYFLFSLVPWHLWQFATTRFCMDHGRYFVGAHAAFQQLALESDFCPVLVNQINRNADNRDGGHAKDQDDRNKACSVVRVELTEPSPKIARHRFHDDSPVG